MNRKLVKKAIYSSIRNYIDLTDREVRNREMMNEHANVLSVRHADSPVLLGIIYDVYQYHKFYVRAALENNLSFDVINLQDNNWWEQIHREPYDGFLVWPNGMRESLKSTYDSRVKMIVDYTNKPVFPDYLAIWLYENKIRTNDWLVVNNFPTVPTFVYFNKTSALEHLSNHSLPVVIKTNLGASGKGVFIIKTAAEYRKVINQCFASGLKSHGVSPYAESRGYAYIQQFIPGMEEWRMVRIGDSFFGHKKLQGKGTEKHSGSLLKGWERPSEDLLNLLYEITERGGFRSMNADMFRDKDGNIYVNELHTVFGQSTDHLMIVDGVPGRYLYENGNWVFEAGDFVRGHSAKARIDYFVNEVILKGRNKT